MTDSVDAFHDQRAAQNERYRLAMLAQGDILDASDTATEEYKRYFGMGEYAGVGIEKRVTLKDCMKLGAAERAAQREAAEAAEAAEFGGWDTPDDTPHTSAEEARGMLKPALLARIMLGDTGAAAELARRAERRASKRAAKVAA